MLTKTSNLIYVLLGLLSLLLGVIGIFLPLLPTTPFLLLSAYCFSKGSKKLHTWLLARPTIGKVIQEWEENRIIRPRAKALSTVMIVLLFGYTFFFVKAHIAFKLISTCIGICVLTFILTRRSH